MIISAGISGRERALAFFAVVSALLVIPALISSQMKSDTLIGPSNSKNAIDDAAENNKQRQPSVHAMSYFGGETKHFSTVFAEETRESKEIDVLYSRTQHHMVSILARKMRDKVVKKLDKDQNWGYQGRDSHLGPENC
jgi:hypothetical protein